MRPVSNTTPAAITQNHRTACAPSSPACRGRTSPGSSDARRRAPISTTWRVSIHGTSSRRLSPRSGEAALRAVGAVCAAVDAVVGGEADNAFCAVRPPGHHAEPERAMGFCLFNSVAIGVQRARQKHGLERAAVIDFDVHHGNGTQATFENNPHVFYASTHQSPLYPGTGARSETGVGKDRKSTRLNSS